MREKRQAEAVEAYMESDGKTIVNACPRFGKIKVAIDIMKAKGYKQPLIAAPRRDIFKGWTDDFEKFGFDNNAAFTTFVSLKKPIPITYDFFIIDEPHEMSFNQQNFAKRFVDKLPTLGLTGTLTQKTRDEMYDNLNLDVCYQYSVAQGVKEGILADYQIYIHEVPLDNTTPQYNCQGRMVTEKRYFSLHKYIRDNTKFKDRWFLDIKLIAFLQKSLAKMNKTKELIREFKGERVLVFCGVTEVADKLCIPVYHSKAREKEIFLDFCGGGLTSKLATIKMMQTGITVSPIDKGIINYMSGNPEDSAQKVCRFLGYEYNNPDKKAEIHIVSSDEDFERDRMKTGLAFFEKEKISWKYV